MLVMSEICPYIDFFHVYVTHMSITHTYLILLYFSIILIIFVYKRSNDLDQNIWAFAEQVNLNPNDTAGKAASMSRQNIIIETYWITICGLCLCGRWTQYYH